MSFSQDVKKELCELKESSKLGKRVLLAGIMYSLKTSREDDSFLQLPLENECVTALIRRLLNKNEYEYGNLYMMIKKPQNYNTDDYLGIIGDDRSAGIFLRGVFLVSGIVADPNNEYHMEIMLPDAKRSDEIYTLINERGIEIKKSHRKSNVFLYIKENEIISDFLTFVGAYKGSMEMMNVKIYKELRNNVNRVVNCEAANIDKTARAATRQLSDIELIKTTKGLQYLSDELRQVAVIRQENVEMSLSEIGNLCVPVISRSGVNHRFKKIHEIADELRAQNQNKE